MQRNSPITIVSLVIIFFGVIINQLTIENFFPGTIIFNSWIKSVLLLIVQGVIIVVGIYIYCKRRRAVKNLMALMFGLLLCVILLELILMVPATHQLDNPSPIWIPQKYRILNEQINEKHKVISRKNPFGFNEQVHLKSKPDSLKYRIAVLGDSFVWGMGVEDSVVWTNKLQSLMNNSGYPTEIMNWGISGWSTADQFNFLRSQGLEYEFNFLIFAFVVNDPATEMFDMIILLGRDGFIQKNFLRYVQVVFPNSVAFLVDLLNNFIVTVFGGGYDDWVDGLFYKDENIKRYKRLLREINQFCNARGIPFAFIMTPESASGRMGRYFSIIQEMLDQENITSLNLYPVVKKEFGSKNPRSLWANPADGHPGTELTSLYARESLIFLQKHLVKQ